jgi:hypothetical protein
MKSGAAAKYAGIALKQGLVPCLWGGPGTGKTQSIVGRVAPMNGFEKIVLVHAGVKEPTDFAGLPFPSECRTYAEFLPFGDLREMCEATVPTLVFLDDVGQAQHSVQAALMQLLEGGNLNGRKMSGQVRFILASNRTEDRAFVQKMISPLENRIMPHIDFEPDLEEWAKIMLERKRSPEIVAFNRWRNGQALYEFGKGKDSKDHAFPTPRSWEKLACFIADPDVDRSDDLFPEIVSGFIGKARGMDFCAFLEVWKELPSKAEVVRDPDKARLPSSAQGTWAVSSWIGSVIDAGNSAAVFRYANRLPAEYAAVAYTDAVVRNPEVAEYPGAADLLIRHQGLMAA